MKHEQYVESTPSPQNLVDLVPGWTSMLPSIVPVAAGPLPLFDDGRVKWALELMGGIFGKNVIELGPLEAAHTYQLVLAGAAHVTAVEANTYSYMKCLIVKELLGLARASFLLGNFVPWLRQGNMRSDILWASGVLYHMTDPIGLLEAAARTSDTVFIWTHYVDDMEMPEGDPRRAMLADSHVVNWRGHKIRLYRRPYASMATDVSFMGGVNPDPLWMERDDILMILGELGFAKIDILPGDPAHPQGPNYSLLARRPAG